jgi:hypothetical protein
LGSQQSPAKQPTVAKWRVKDWLGINADLGYQGYFSDTVLETPPDDQPDWLGYHIFTAFLGVRIFL